jgi:serine O-acetyltransferase
MSRLPLNPMALYYAANYLYKHRVPLIPWILRILLFILCRAVIPFSVDIGPKCKLSHGGNGIVIHGKVQIGSNVLIGTQVTIGGRGKREAVPIIGNNVYIGSGAKILGPIEIGSDSVIGANAVVISSVPAGCVAAGVPARIIRTNIRAQDIEQW